MNVDQISKKLIKIAGFIFGGFVLILIVFALIFYINFMPVNNDDERNVSFIVASGEGKYQILKNLEEAKLIKNASILKLYVKFNVKEDFLAGTYNLSPSMDAMSIIEALTTGSSIENETISITFVEGKRFPYYVSKIAENFEYAEKDIYSVITEQYLNNLITKYWFIDESILNKELYYPLEGYLFPDTYEFKKSATVEEIFDKMLTVMGDKLKAYEDEIKVSKYNIHSLLTLASMVELEAVTAEDRLVLAGVFENRLNAGWTLGSDVTTYYAVKKEMTQSLTRSDLNSCNAYNTRGTCVKGLPVGPICSPSYQSITAAINPEETKYLYFVADTSNKLYYGVTEADHNKNIRDLKHQGIWPE